MTNGRNLRSRVDRSRVPGPFLALPHSVTGCPAYIELSHPAKALLIEIARQYNRRNNGQLLASRAFMAKRGWKSADVLQRAKKELLEFEFIAETVKGHRPNKASWYAITWHCLNPHSDYDAGVAATFATGAYERSALTPKRGP
ncbi:hypothetical protein [Pelomonas sp. SE-A7]|uniref:hypothetical protein n=1 Tax=Pelomonas sp. SE-A7 TaxID=3054953 RepID=UPI00259CE521|nr:hypothetical protein [Pelomonas sp. SE-A7]MDM4765533.1 hypothetical protein [Pelomonas sp. SE-A7]